MASKFAVDAWMSERMRASGSDLASASLMGSAAGSVVFLNMPECDWIQDANHCDARQLGAHPCAELARLADRRCGGRFWPCCSS